MTYRTILQIASYSVGIFYSNLEIAAVFKLRFEFLSDTVSITAFLIVQCIRWFAQLLALPMLSILHFLSVFRPVEFRNLRLSHAYGISKLSISVTLFIFLNPWFLNASAQLFSLHTCTQGWKITAFFAGLFMSLSALLTAPLLTTHCYIEHIIEYYVNGAFWSFDFAKLGTALYTQLNLVL